nr:hypothetical protein [Streptomyces sp. SBT349]
MTRSTMLVDPRPQYTNVAPVLSQISSNCSNDASTSARVRSRSIPSISTSWVRALRIASITEAVRFPPSRFCPRNCANAADQLRVFARVNAGTGSHTTGIRFSSGS